MSTAAEHRANAEKHLAESRRIYEQEAIYGRELPAREWQKSVFHGRQATIEALLALSAPPEVPGGPTGPPETVA